MHVGTSHLCQCRNIQTVTLKTSLPVGCSCSESSAAHRQNSTVCHAVHRRKNTKDVQCLRYQLFCRPAQLQLVSQSLPVGSTFDVPEHPMPQALYLLSLMCVLRGCPASSAPCCLPTLAKQWLYERPTVMPSLQCMRFHRGPAGPKLPLPGAITLSHTPCKKLKTTTEESCKTAHGACTCLHLLLN